MHQRNHWNVNLFSLFPVLLFLNLKSALPYSIMLSFCYYDRRLCRSNCEADHQDPSPPFSAFQERALKAGIITGLSRQDLSPELCVITVSLHSGTVFTKVLPEKCVHASTSRHHSSTWPVQTCFHAPDHNDKQPQMADLCLQGRFKVTAVNKANRFFFSETGMSASIKPEGRSSAKPHKHLWNVAAPLHFPFLPLSLCGP